MSVDDMRMVVKRNLKDGLAFPARKELGHRPNLLTAGRGGLPNSTRTRNLADERIRAAAGHRPLLLRSSCMFANLLWVTTDHVLARGSASSTTPRRRQATGGPQAHNGTRARGPRLFSTQKSYRFACSRRDFKSRSEAEDSAPGGRSEISRS